MHPEKSRWALPQPRSLAARLTLTFVGAGFALTLLTAWLAGAFFRNHLETRTAAAFDQYAKQVAAKLSRDAVERGQDLQQLAIRELLVSPQGTAEARRELLEKERENLGLAWLALTDTSGRVIAASGGHLEGASVAQASWFIEGLARLHVGRDLPDPPLAAALEERSRFMALATPVRNASGEVVGVLGAQQYLSYNQQNSPLPPGASREGIVANAYSADGAGSERRWLLSSSGVAGKAPLPAPITTTKLLSWRETHDGVDYLMGFGRSAGYHGVSTPAWLVAVRQRADLAYAPAVALRWRLLRWGAGLTLLCALPVALSARKLGRRLRAVAAAAERIRSGETLTAMPVFPGKDELARMSANLSELVESFRAQRAVPLLVSSAAPAPLGASPVPEEYTRPAGTDPRRVAW